MDSRRTRQWNNSLHTCMDLNTRIAERIKLTLGNLTVTIAQLQAEKEVLLEELDKEKQENAEFRKQLGLK